MSSGHNQAVRAPCERCVRSGRECIVTSDSQRGKWKRQKRTTEQGHVVSVETAVTKPGDSTRSPRVQSLLSPATNTVTDVYGLNEQDQQLVQSLSVSPSARPSPSSQAAAGADTSQASRRDLRREELQNPADALDILCSVTGHISAAPSRMPSPAPTATEGVPRDSRPLDGSAYLTRLLEEEQPIPSPRQACHLIRNGILSEDRLKQLVDTFIKSYHPYYPLVATRRLAPALLGSFASEDPILLTAICVIASRSDVNHQLHLRLLDNAKEMLSGAMWGGCATVGSIEALLLLSEWVAPQLQVHSGVKVKESSMIWMTVGTASMILYAAEA